jgi:hypothetical protein
MGPAGLVEHPGKENLVRIKGRSANRTFPFGGPASLKAIDASRDVHEPAPAVPRIGKDRRLHEFPVFQEEAADRAASCRTSRALPDGSGLCFVKLPSGWTLL